MATLSETPMKVINTRFKNGKLIPEYAETSGQQVKLTVTENIIKNNAQEEFEELAKALKTVENQNKYKGIINAESGVLVPFDIDFHWQIGTAGTYFGNQCEAGDFLVAVTQKETGTATAADFKVVQGNLVNAVTGPQGAVNENIPLFDGTTGHIIKDSNISLADLQKPWVVRVSNAASFDSTTAQEGALVIVETA